MKRKLSLIVLIAMLAVVCFGVFAACKNDGLDEYALKLFVNQVEKQIANAQGKTSYTLSSVLTATNVDDEEITCNVDWTADNGVTLAKGTTTIDVTVPAGVSSYILTGTLVDGKGNKYDVEGNPVMKSVSVNGGNQGGNQGGSDTPSGDKGTTQSNPYTVAEALSVINGLEQGGYSSAMVYTKGLVSDYKAGSSGQYRCSISDTASGTKLSVWYSNLGNGVTSFKNGDTIIVYGYLMRFWDNKNQKETPEITNKSDDASSTPTIVSVVDGGGSTTPGGGNQGGGTTTTPDGTKVIIDLTGKGEAGSADGSSQGGTAFTTLTQGDITIEASAGTNKNAPPKYYPESLRLYGSNTLTVTASAGKTIKSITFTFGQYDKTNAITTDVGTFSTDTWTGSANSVVFSIASGSGHRRIATITIIYE